MSQYLPLFFSLSIAALIAAVGAIITLLVSNGIQKTKTEYQETRIANLEASNQEHRNGSDSKLDKVLTEITNLKVEIAELKVKIGSNG
jgi:hypothetical protein